MSYIIIKYLKNNNVYSVARGRDVKAVPNLSVAIRKSIECMLKSGEYVYHNYPSEEGVLFTLTPDEDGFYSIDVFSEPPGRADSYIQMCLDEVVDFIYEYAHDMQFIIFIEPFDNVLQPVNEMSIRDMGNEIANLTTVMVNQRLSDYDSDWDSISENYARIVEITNRMKFMEK